jgi:hypothetical protein
VQLVTEGEVLKFQNRPTVESPGKNRDDERHELKHGGDTTAAHTKTLDFSALSEFLVGTGVAPDVFAVGADHHFGRVRISWARLQRTFGYFVIV